MEKKQSEQKILIFLLLLTYSHRFVLFQSFIITLIPQFLAESTLQATKTEKFLFLWMGARERLFLVSFMNLIEN
jgi:uncharacterized protein YqhQ